MLNSVDLNINLQALLRFEIDAWVAWCPSLDISSQAETQELALQSLQEAVELWFESCLERGVLREALKEAGFVPAGSTTSAGNAGTFMEKESLEKPIHIRIPAYMAAELLESGHAAN